MKKLLSFCVALFVAFIIISIDALLYGGIDVRTALWMMALFISGYFYPKD